MVCDSYVRPATLVRICDECNYGSYAGRCVICGGVGISDAYYCKECTQQEKDVSPFKLTEEVLGSACNSCDAAYVCLTMDISLSFTWLMQRDGCPKIVNLGSAKTDLFYERKKYGFKKR